MHARQTIREAIATVLAAATPTNWGKVFETRLVTSRQVMPFLIVYASDETATSLLIHPSSIYDRMLTINIVGMLKMPGTGDGTSMTETIEDRMDAMSAEIETKLTNTSLQAIVAKAKALQLQSTAMEVVVNETDGSISHAELTQTWVVSYDTVEGAPEVLI